jgi:hypothetical protein
MEKVTVEAAFTADPQYLLESVTDDAEVLRDALFVRASYVAAAHR